MLDHDDESPDIARLKPNMRAALDELARGGRYRDAALAAGVNVSRIWSWARRYPPFRDALATAIELHDKRLDTLEAALDAAVETPRDKEAMDAGLKAANTLGRGVALGIGSPASQGSDRARVDVTLTLDLPGLLRAPSLPALDVPRASPIALDAPGELAAPALPAPPPGAVAEAQPRRSRASSRRRVVER